ncbi:MAG: GNAT family N-acetyltransferase [Propionibacteriaceae bacterium]|jgi:predicted GNAT family acetyltransferase|nr:GNAT family N-acetyltransferase [Propionibacteriaceae bacterium]
MRARILTPSDAEAVKRLLRADPVSSIFVASRVESGVLQPHTPGTLWGWPEGDFRALLHIGRNMVPVAADQLAISAFVEAVGRRRLSQAILGPADMALQLWAGLARRWGRNYSVTREIRPRQPLMAISTAPRWPADTRVRPITFREFDSYLAASLAMFREEVGSGTMDQQTEDSFRRYCHSLVANGRAFGIVEDGHVVFKADIGAAGNLVAQMQGVWLHPSHRGQGISAGAVAAVTEYVLADYRTACLYVNDFNVRAIRCYERVGFSQTGEFSTVLF